MTDLGVVLRDRDCDLVLVGFGSSRWKGLARRKERGGVVGAGPGGTFSSVCSLRLTPIRLPLMPSHGGGVGESARYRGRGPDRYFLLSQESADCMSMLGDVVSGFVAKRIDVFWSVWVGKSSGGPQRL